MTFGIHTFNKGTKFTNEHKKKISVGNSGKVRSLEVKQHLRDLYKGKKWEQLYGKEKSDEMKKKLGLSNKKPCPEETKNKIRLTLSGRHRSEETKRKIKLKRENTISPKKDTSIEVKIQEFLKLLGIEYFTHQYMKEIEHGYQCDIFIPSLNMVIECDGNYWHKYPTRRHIDNIRTQELIERGFRVLRLWESEIKCMDLEKFEFILKERNTQNE